MKDKRNLGVLSPSELESVKKLRDFGVFSPSEVNTRGYKYFPDNDSYGVLSPSEIKIKKGK